MVATVLNLPRWLIASIVFCAVIGHFQQVECKLTGCHSSAADTCAKAVAGEAHDQNDPSPPTETTHCDCQCHFSVAIFEHPHSFAVVRSARQMRIIERSINAPDAPCVEIEYPPKSVRA